MRRLPVMMMRSLTRTILLAVVVVVAVCVLADHGQAQGSGAPSALPPSPATDSIFKRARRLVSEGNGATGRALVDSLLSAASEGTPPYGDALFWRGALAETAADAERDYRRVIVEYPLSPYADDALLSLAELEQARGDRAAAYQHLQRFVREHPASAARARAGLAAARLAFEQHDAVRGCAMIADARTSAGTSDVELRNQIEYYGAHCSATATPTSTAPSVTTAGATRTASARSATGQPTRTTTSASPTPSRSEGAAASTPIPPATSVAQPEATMSSTTTSATTAPTSEPTRSKANAVKNAGAKESVVEPHMPRGIWTIQLAAYNTRADAERLVSKLSARGVKARISGDVKPFRVRLDYFPTRQAAAIEVAALKQRGIIGFVTDEPRATGATRP
jgi:cell division septation protein DedD